jgi:hypothetical protein
MIGMALGRLGLAMVAGPSGVATVLGAGRVQAASKRASRAREGKNRRME